jgi:hypothetical protein
MGDEAAIANRTVADHRVESARGDVDEPVVELKGHRHPRMLLHETDQLRREVQASEADRGREPQRTRQLAATLGKLIASCTSCRIRRALRRNAWPSSVNDILRVVRWARRPPNSRSSSARRSLTTDFGTPRRRAASLIHPAWATAVNAVRPSSFIIVRRSRKPVPVIGGYSGQWTSGIVLSRHRRRRAGEVASLSFIKRFA